MIHPLFGDTITLYHKSADSYTRHVIYGVQWRQKVERFMYQRGQSGVFDIKTVTTVTIPAGVAGAEKISPAEGDVMVLGKGPQLTASYTIANLKADFPSYCTVRAVSDNTQRPRLKHWKVIAV